MTVFQWGRLLILDAQGVMEASWEAGTVSGAVFTPLLLLNCALFKSFIVSASNKYSM